MKLIPKFLDPTDITTLVNKGTGKHVIADGFSTIPIYKGKLYSIKDVVNNDGTVNIRKAKKIMEEVAEYFGGKKMLNRLENPIWHKDDPNTWLHTKKVAQNAWAIPVPEGYTKLDLMIAALGHDFGKILSGDGHAEVSYNLIKLIFPDATPKLLEAIRRHMDDLGTHTDLLELATKFADIGVVPGADFTQIGLTPEELEIVKLTKWFKEGGNILYFDKGGAVYKLLNELYHKVNKGIPLADWSPEQWDLVYNYVLKRYGEKESNILQKIRDYHFWAKAPNTKLSEVSGKPIEVVHHTNSDPFTVFDKKRRGQTDSGHRGLGYYFDSKQTYNPEIYGKNTISAYLNILNPIEGISRKNLSTLDDIDQYIINLGKGTRNELIAERVAKGLGKDSEEISDLIIISKYYLKLRRVNKSYKNYIPEDLKTLGLKADSSDLEIEQAVENKVKELLLKEAERYYPKNFDSIDGYMDEYENVVYSPTQIKSSASITRDDLGNIIPLLLRDNFNNEDIRFKDGGTLKLLEGGVLQESTEPLFRHLPNEYIALDFDNDLTELFYSRQIKYGQLSEKAERKLLKKYNLDYTLLKETLDDLFNAGLGEALIADLIKDTPENSEKDIPIGRLGLKVGSKAKVLADPETVEKAALLVNHFMPEINLRNARKIIEDGIENGSFNKEFLKGISLLKSGNHHAINAYNKLKSAEKYYLDLEKQLKEKGKTLNSNDKKRLQAIQLLLAKPIRVLIENLFKQRKNISKELVDEFSKTAEGLYFYTKLKKSPSFKQGIRYKELVEAPFSQETSDLLNKFDLNYLYTRKGKASGEKSLVSDSLLKTYQNIYSKTNDEKVGAILLALKDAKKTNAALPEEFLTYIKSILKTPKKTSTGIGKFEETTIKTAEDLVKLDLDKKFDIALDSLRDINKGEFKISEDMLIENYVKGGGVSLHYLKNKEWTNLQRDLFAKEEWVEAGMDLIGDISTIPNLTDEEIFNFVKNLAIPQRFHRNYHGDLINDPTFGLHYKRSEENIDNLRVLASLALKQAKELFGEKAKIILLPIYGSTPKPVPIYGPKGLEFIQEDGFSHLVGYDFMVDTGKTVKGKPVYEAFQPNTRNLQLQLSGKQINMPIPDDLYRISLELHHAKPLSVMMQEAIIGASKEGITDPKGIVEWYKKHRPDDWMKQFMLLDKEYHIGKDFGIHKADTYLLLDLARQKSWALSGLFDSVDSLENAYRKVFTERYAWMKANGDPEKYKEVMNNLPEFDVIIKESIEKTVDKEDLAKLATSVKQLKDLAKTKKVLDNIKQTSNTLGAILNSNKELLSSLTLDNLAENILQKNKTLRTNKLLGKILETKERIESRLASLKRLLYYDNIPSSRIKLELSLLEKDKIQYTNLIENLIPGENAEEKLLKDSFLSVIPTAKQGTKLIPKNAFGSALMRELVPKASKITGKTERQLIKELALGTLSEKKLMELTKDVVESVNGKILKPELIKPGMLDFEHYWYFGHGTDVEHLPSIMLTGLKGSLSDTAINLFFIGNLEAFDAALEMAKQGKGLHHNAKGFNIILVPKLPGQNKPPKDLWDYLTPEEMNTHIVDDRTPARFNYFAVDTTI